MLYPTIQSGDAGNYLTAKRAGTSVDVDTHIRMRGAGDPMDLSFAPQLRADLDALRATFPKGITAKSDPNANAFEAKASRIVHEAMPSDAEALSDPEFWIWLALAHCAETVEWRYRFGKEESNAQPGNYGVGSRTENFIYRLWMRADIVLDETLKDRYALSKGGQIDFYRSHLFRQGYATARPFSRALMRFQYPGDDPTDARLKTNEIRELVKRLRRLRSNLFLEILPEDECMEVIKMEAEVIKAEAEQVAAG